MRVTMNGISIGSIVSEGFKLGFKNIASLIGAVFLWIITIWIPYINVGTTIGLLSIVIAMSKGSMISPTEIFDRKYRQYMGEFFLIVAFLYIGITVGFVFLVIPGLVISLAWGQSIYLMLDREMNPIEALKVSNQITYGEKWTIFWGTLILGLIFYALILVLSGIGYMISETAVGILSVIGVIVFYPIMLGAYAHIYGQLVKKLDQAE